MSNFFPKIFLKTKFNLENLICDGSLSLIGYAAVNAFGYAWRKYQNINILRVAEYPVMHSVLIIRPAAPKCLLDHKP